MGSIDRRLQELGLEIPTPAEPKYEYVPTKRVGDLIFVSGQGPSRNGEDVYVGQVGADLTVEEGQAAARLCAINCLACLKQAVGSLENIEDIVQLTGFVNSAPGFGQQPEVMNAASRLFGDVFGEHGRHARAALGTSNLPGNIAVEILIVAKVKDGV